MQPRIACLVPSLTLLLVQLGLRPWLVARSGFCIHPQQDLEQVPKVGGTKDVQLQRLRALAPTHVLVNVDENRLETAEALRSFVPQVVVTHPCSPDDQPALLALLLLHFGDLPGVRAAAAQALSRYEATVAGLRGLAFADRRVLCLIWREPWMTVARETYISRLLAKAGLHTWPDQLGGASGAARYPVLRGDEPWLAQVEAVLLPTEPYRFDASHRAEVERLCPQARLLWVDGEALSWHGGMTVEGLELVRDLALQLDQPHDGHAAMAISTDVAGQLAPNS